jgi:hypothetical protein
MPSIEQTRLEAATAERLGKKSLSRAERRRLVRQSPQTKSFLHTATGDLTEGLAQTVGWVLIGYAAQGEPEKATIFAGEIIQALIDHREAYETLVAQKGRDLADEALPKMLWSAIKRLEEELS